MRAGIKYSRLAAILITILFTSGLYAASAKNPLDRFGDKQKAKLLAGEAIYEYVIDDTGKNDKAHGRAVALVNAPAAEGYKIFCDFEKEYLYFPRMTVSKVLKVEGNSYTVYKELDFGIATLRYTPVSYTHLRAHET